MQKLIKPIFLLMLIMGIALFFRLYDINWDQGFHLHPDERFLTMVGVQFSLPHNFSQYLNPMTSPMNPSVLGFNFFVYGIFPITINFILSLIFHTQTYDLFTIQGRVLSAAFDTLSVLVIFLIAFLLEKEAKLSKQVKYLATFFYAIAVFPIQLSHFFTVDIFLSFFMVTSFYFFLLFGLRRKLIFIILAGVFLGVGTACKITALTILPLGLLLTALPFVSKKLLSMQFFAAIILLFLSFYSSVRIADPYLFTSADFFDFRISSTFLLSIQTLKSYDNPHIFFPPGIQWDTKVPIIFSFKNIAIFGLGIGMSFFSLLGILRIFRQKNVYLISSTLWVILFFLYQSSVFVKTMRYFIFLYPFLALFAAIGFSTIIQYKNKFVILLSALVIIIWPCMFLSVYTKPHTRVTASEWIYQHIPPGSTILGEYWDDPLPLSGKSYTITLLHVFDPDTADKWKVLNQELAHADYLILSSNRGWGSISVDKDKYPLMSAWYRDLFAGKLPFRQVAKFTSYPSLSYLGIPLTMPDDFAEEAFTVYDHPKVLIFKNERKSQ